MVHALQQIHGLLAPGGCLIDMHPNGEPPPITVRLGPEHHLAGWVRETSEYESYDLADKALATAVSHHFYHQQRQETFAFITYFDTLADLQQFLTDEWNDAYLEDQVARHIESLMHSPDPDQEIILKEIVKITRLNPLDIMLH